MVRMSKPLSLRLVARLAMDSILASMRGRWLSATKITPSQPRRISFREAS